jgi:hypothetical protein
MPTTRRAFLQTSALAALPPGAQTLPTVRLGKYQVTRLIIGANPFYGYSHFNKLLDQHMLEWCTAENVCKTLRRCEEMGINTWQFSNGGRGLEDLKRYRAEGGKLQWMLLSGRQIEENLDLIPEIAKLKPIGIVHHGGTTDRRWRAGEQGKIKEFLQRVRDAGVMVGLSTHNPEILEATEEQGWDIDYYMGCVYQVTRTQEELRKMLGRRAPLGENFFPDDPPRMYQAMRKSRKTCLAFKILAAGRLISQPQQIDQAFRLAFDSIKPQDCVIVGMYPKFSDEVKDNADRVRRVLAT